jgi:hypothetical protein
VAVAGIAMNADTSCPAGNKPQQLTLSFSGAVTLRQLTAAYGSPNVDYSAPQTYRFTLNAPFSSTADATVPGGALPGPGSDVVVALVPPLVVPAGATVTLELVGAPTNAANAYVWLTALSEEQPPPSPPPRPPLPPTPPSLQP